MAEKITDTLARFVKTDDGQYMDKVQGFLHTPGGTYKYEVFLDYSDIWHHLANGPERDVLKALGVETRYMDPKDAALEALRTATERNTSGVSISELKDHWTLVVPDPPNGFPVLVHPENHLRAIQALHQ